MLKKIMLPSIFGVLAYGFWISPDFKQIAAGVAIFLFGMLSLEEGFRAFTGGLLEKILQRTTNTLGKALSFGVATTTIMQSSSLVSVITISFLSAGLIGLAAGIGIIFGANLGTTTGAWLVAGFGLKVKISAYAMPMLVFGIILVFQKSKAMKGVGYVLAGLGFLFLGIHHMKEGFETFKETIDLAAFAVPGFAGLLLFALIGIFATVVMQSSHATLVLIITALAAGQITYENALALAIGANVGTTITAIIGSMSADYRGKQLAGAHLIFNVITGLIAIIAMPEFVWAVEHVAGAVGIAHDDHTLKLAVFHTLFNLTGILVMLPFTDRLVKFLEGAIRPKKIAVNEPKYINEATIDFPETAVEAVRNETLGLLDSTINIILRGLNLPPQAVLEGQDPQALAKTTHKLQPFDIEDAYEKNVKGIYSEIIAFISRASFTWEMEQSGDLHWLRGASLSLVEAIKDTKHLQNNLRRFLISSNPAIQGEYDQIRAQLAHLIQQINLLRNEDDPDMAILALDELKVEMENFDKQLNERLVQLLHDQAIEANMATSLMNDSAYAYDVAKYLLRACETLFVAADRETTGAVRQIQLQDDELEQIADTHG